MLRLKPLLLLALGSALATGGCSSQNHNSDGTPKAQNYPVDGYMGITSANPNDPMNPTYHHYRDDTKLMQNVVAPIKGVQNSTIFINGRYANVLLQLQPGLSAQDAQRAQIEAYHALSQNMPRYQIRVSTSNQQTK